MEDQLQPCAEWLQQGDVFALLPFPKPGPDFGARWGVEWLPGILLTGDCQIDKTKAERLHFAPALPIGDLDSADQRLLRRDDLGPYDGLRIGVDPEGVEHYCRLSMAIWLPLDQLGETEWLPPPDDDQPRRKLSGRKRLGTLPDERRQLLQQKLSAFWTGFVPNPAPLPPPPAE